MGEDKQHERKRKRFEGGRIAHGSNQHKKRNLGGKDQPRRDRRQEWETKRNFGPRTAQDGKESVLPKPFSEEEIAQEERRPKHKVAVMMGYSGTGYKGMQINTSEKTIEGDLFTAFVAAGAISKANANDPRKSGLVRCARTDKGVHAAGNVISLKLIIEDGDIIQKINDNLTSQIRVWGIERTVNSFSAYQACDSRWYEYFIPTHAFLPPHPNSQLARRLKELAQEAGDLEGYTLRQAEVADYWARIDEESIKPLLESLDPAIRPRIEEALYTEEADDAEEPAEDADPGTTSNEANESNAASNEVAEDGASATKAKLTIEQKRALTEAVRKLKRAYVRAKRAYRISPERLARIQPVLDAFVGTNNFHNYTVDKLFRDASAQRIIKSFKLDPNPKLVNGTEWLSMKIHGQSFMMHQIRKMVGMLSLVVRCGCPVERIAESFGAEDFNIPKVPGLGLLLEAPVFESYNDGPAAKFERAKIDFTRYEKEMNEFKEREIYQRIFREEEESNAFHVFYSHCDHVKGSQLLYLSSMGHEAVTKYALAKAKAGDATRAGKASQAAKRGKGRSDGQIDSSDDSDGAGSEQ